MEVKIDMQPRLRITVLWIELSGYFNACLQELVNRYHAELQIFRITRMRPDTPLYRDDIFIWVSKLHTLTDGSKSQFEYVFREVSNFSPDVILVSGWSVPVYRQVIRQMHKRGVRIISGLDNPWRGTQKQYLGVVGAPFVLHPLFDDLWVPGERAAVFARKLGYRGRNLLTGFYSADRSIFEPIAKWRLEQQSIAAGWQPRFLFVGRYVEEKGFPELITAYLRYRQAVHIPWELWCAGRGPLEDMLNGIEGIRNLGFVQPTELPQIFKQAGVFILPSRHEPWGVVIHEATTSGLPILCTHQCGSSVELVQDGFNGFRFEAEDIETLAKLMLRVSTNEDELRLMGIHSVNLSERFSSGNWADTIIDHMQSLK